MDNAKLQILKPVWHDGLLLQAQHLQLLEKYFCQQQEYARLAFGSDNWGVLQLSVDQNALLVGQYRLLAAILRMPNGCWIKYDIKVQPALYCKLPAASTNVYLHCVATCDSLLAEYGNAAVYTSDHIETYTVTDCYNSELSAKILAAEPRVILSTEKNLENSVTHILLTHLQLHNNGVYAEDCNFTPPCLLVNASQNIYRWREMLLESLAHVSESNVSRQFADKQLQLCLLRMQAQLKFMDGMLHPRHIWQQWACLLAECSALLGRTISCALNYEHATGYSLYNLFKAMLQCLQADVKDYVICEQKDLGGGLFAIDTSILGDALGGRLLLEIFSSDCTVVEKWVRAIKILPEDKIAHSQRYALPGLPLINIKSTDQSGSMLWHVQIASLKTQKLASQSLCLYVQSMPNFKWRFIYKRDLAVAIG